MVFGIPVSGRLASAMTARPVNTLGGTGPVEQTRRWCCVQSVRAEKAANHLMNGEILPRAVAEGESLAIGSGGSNWGD
ncbi:hypothetical protein SV7mr_38050 [Stieleria bergensis]|uniref:Uncharacterized protein n=1 Tax=Stieleria bergensis TaxID=2528025 RepID=A0A517SZ11_9BACT|nr:hypothetical protein SV7mr_38050 [Planctomycetes bacterium SV_7m_r]